MIPFEIVKLSAREMVTVCEHGGKTILLSLPNESELIPSYSKTTSKTVLAR